MKATGVAPSNIAFVKYWGKKDEILRLPENGSLSMNLSGLLTTTTVEYAAEYKDDEVIINGVKEDNAGSRAIKHLDRVRKLAGINERARVMSKNNFPTGTGLSSSASGFAALTVAAASAAGLKLSEKELSILARQGSGSACRSIPDGFTEWLDGESSDTSYAISVFPENHWELVDVVVIVSTERKEVTTSEGQKLAATSPFLPVRLAGINDKLRLAKEYIIERNLVGLGELAEAEALNMHAVMLTSTPSLIYWTAETLQIMKLTKKWRGEGLPVYFTINTGQDIHLLCERVSVNELLQQLKTVEEVREVIVNTPAVGARIVEKSLF